MRLLSVTLALALSGCAANEPSPWHGDVTFTPDERTAILAARAFVEAKTGAEHRDVVFDLPHPAEGATPALPWPIIRREGLTGDELGFTDFTDGRIQLLAGLAPETMRHVAAHEFGHSEAMGHTTPLMGPVPLMYPITYLDQDLVWTAADHDECVRAGNPSCAPADP